MKQNTIFKTVYILMLILVVSITSCRTTEKGTSSSMSKTTKEEILFSKIVEQQPKYSTATIKCSVAIDKISSKAQIKMINGEYIQISLQPLLGIEMFRVMITTDSLYVIDKINSLVARESITEVKNKLPQGCGIKELQKMILGVPFVVGDTLSVDKYSNFTMGNQGTDAMVMSSNVGDVATVSFKCDLQGVLQNTQILYKAMEVLDCEYKKRIVGASGVSQPSELSIKSNIPQLGMPISLNLTNMSIEWDKKVVKDTQVSSRYKKVSLQEIIGKYIAQ